ncbi:MAG: hypothetical protein ACO1PI_12070 [Bacteroidota bacterium]
MQQNKKHDTNILSSDSCTIDIYRENLNGEYNCSIFVFKYNNKILYTDTSFEYTTIYYPIVNSSSTFKLFDLYDLPTGRRKLLLFNFEKKNIFKSDWFDNSALGDSIDVKSINLNKKNFLVWSNSGEAMSQYFVNLCEIKSW